MPWPLALAAVTLVLMAPLHKKNDDADDPAPPPGSDQSLDANALAPLPGSADDGDDATPADANESLPAVLDMNQALSIFQRRGFDPLVAEYNIASAEGGVDVSGAVNNPQLSGGYAHAFNYAPDGCPKGSDCAADGFNASFSDSAALFDVLTGKRGLRVDVARAVVKATRADYDDARRNLVFALKAQFLAVAVDKANLAFARQVMNTYASTMALFTTRYEAGDISEADLARMDTGSLEAEQQVDNAILQLQQDKIGLAFLLGIRGMVPQYDIRDSWFDKAARTLADGLSVQDLLTTARAHRPDLVSQAAKRDRAQAAIDLAYRSRVPDIALNVGYQQQGTGSAAIQPQTLTAGLTLTLPMFYQFQGELRQAQADADIQTTLLRKLEAQVASDVSMASVGLISARSRVERMRSRLRVRAARALELVQLQYRKGAASLLDLLDAQRTFIAINQEYFGDMSDYWTAIFQMEQATAAEFRP